MAPNNQQQQAAVATAVIHLPDFHADSPQCWFDCLDSTFATTNITKSITKFHWAMSKQPFSLIATVRPLARDPTAVGDPFKELKELLLRSYGPPRPPLPPPPPIQSPLCIQILIIN
jgi:hypothetical protein